MADRKDVKTGRPAAKPGPPRPDPNQGYATARPPRRQPERFSGSAEDWPAEAPVAITEPPVRIARSQADIGQANSRGRFVDVHEVLKRGMFAGPNDASDNHFEKNRPSPDAIFGVSDQYVILDSFEQVGSSSRPMQGRYDWNFMVQGSTGNQTIGVKDKVDTVIEVQIGPFIAPPLATVPYTLNDPGPFSNTGVNTSLPILVANEAPPAPGSLTSQLTQLPYGGRATVELTQMGLQSISDSKGARHHFEFQVTNHLIATSFGATDTGMLVFTPLFDWNVYVFTDPIKDVHGLSLQFRNPDIPLQLPNSCLYNSFAQVDAGAQFFQFNTPTPHGLTTGDRVFIRSITTGNPILDNYLNSPAGLIVGSAGTTANSFRLNPDVSTLLLGLALGATIPSTTSITVCVAKYRIRVPLRLRRVVPRLTNYMAP